MNQYTYAITLHYEYDHGSSISRNIKYQYENLDYRDVSGAHIHLDENFELTISNVIANSETSAFIAAGKIADKVCRTLTLILQFSNYDNMKNSPNITYIPSRLKLLKAERCDAQQYQKRSDGSMSISDSVFLHDGLSVIITSTLDLKDFGQIYTSFDCDKPLCIGDAIYRAVLSKNIRGRFFQLFTIIEALETKFGKDTDIAHKILPEDKLNELNKIINDYLKSISMESNFRGNLSSGIGNLIANATQESRVQKLQLIIKDKLGIQRVQKGLISYDITEQKIKNFVDTRNNLFHGGNSAAGENELVQLTNELQELCLEIHKRVEL